MEAVIAVVILMVVRIGIPFGLILALGTLVNQRRVDHLPTGGAD